MKNKIDTAVIPCAGRGTRLLPLTNVIPKELLPVGTKPMIEYAVNEALEAGIKTFYVIVSPFKSILKKYLQKRFCSKASFHFIMQEKPKGVAHAIHLVKPYIRDDEYFWLFMPDNVIFYKQNPLMEILKYFNRFPAMACAVHRVNKETEKLYGNCGRLTTKQVTRNLVRILHIQSKGKGNFVSNRNEVSLRMCGRQILNTLFFSTSERMKKTRQNGEWDDTPVFQEMLRQKEECMGVFISGKVFDCGNFNGYAQANVFALKSGER